MIFLYLYLVIAIVVNICCGYYTNLELDDAFFVSIFWPILFVVVLVLSPYVLGKWLKEHKIDQISFINFFKSRLL